MRDLQSLVQAELWDRLFDAPDESARTWAFVELVRSSCDLSSCSLWRQVIGDERWWPMARTGSLFDEREGLLVAALAQGSLTSVSFPDLLVRGPFGTASTPWFLSLVGPLEEECHDLVDALAVVWEHVGATTTAATDVLPGPKAKQTALEYGNQELSELDFE